MSPRWRVIICKVGVCRWSVLLVLHLGVGRLSFVFTTFWNPCYIFLLWATLFDFIWLLVRRRLYLQQFSAMVIFNVDSYIHANVGDFLSFDRTWDWPSNFSELVDLSASIQLIVPKVEWEDYVTLATFVIMRFSC